MRKPVLLMDMDGVVADFDACLYRWCLTSGLELDIDNADAPGRSFWLTDHLTNEADVRRARKVIETTRYFRHLPEVSGALEGVPKLMEHFDVWVCTKPLEANERCRDDKAAWIRDRWPELEHKLIIAPDKSLVHGDILLDDRPLFNQTRPPSWQPVVFRHAYNGAGTEWADLPSWDWSEPVERLLSWLP